MRKIPNIWHDPLITHPQQGQSKAAFQTNSDYCIFYLWKSRVLTKNIFNVVEIYTYLSRGGKKSRTHDQ